MGKNNNGAESAKASQTNNTKNAAATGDSKPAQTIEEAKAILDKVFKPETQTEEAPKIVLTASAIVPAAKTEEAAAPAETAPETEEAPKQPTEPKSEPQPLTFAEMQAKINAELSRLKQQQERAAKRETLVNCKREMKEYCDRLAQTESFEADFCRLSFQTLGEEYSRQNFKDSFLISNPAIIRKFCDILAAEVDTKIKEIENEIING